MSTRASGTRADPAYRVVNGLGRAALRVLGLDLHWTGAEHIPTTGPVVLAATHVSYPDFLLVERVAVTRRRYVRFLARHEVWSVPVVRQLMDAMRHVPVDRAVPAHAYLRARRLLEEGEAVGVFPEAGISHSRTVRPLMPGAVALARATGAPLVPIAIWGSQRVASVGVRTSPPPDLTRGRRADLAVGPPSYVDPGEDLTDRTRQLGHDLTVLLERLQGMSVHQPRPGEHATWHPAHLGGHAPTRHRARALDVVPRSAVLPSWGPDLDAYADAPPAV